jgi:N-terminal acetyltransferase B complex catalytic subunit
MSYIRRMTPTDLFSLNLANLDPLTENYDLGFYLNYLMRWPSLFSVVQDRDAGIVGYSMKYMTLTFSICESATF